MSEAGRVRQYAKLDLILLQSGPALRRHQDQVKLWWFDHRGKYQGQFGQNHHWLRTDRKQRPELLFRNGVLRTRDRLTGKFVKPAARATPLTPVPLQPNIKNVASNVTALQART